MKSKQRVFDLRKAAMLMALVALSLLIISAWVYAQSGGGYDLTWNTLGSGGGSNSGGGYTLNGTIGQPGAGVLSSGGYNLIGGFWWSEQVPVGIIVDPSLGGLLIFTDTQGLTTTVQIPPGAVTSTTWISMTPTVLPPGTISASLRFAGHAFYLDAYRDGQLLTGFTFETTVTVTIRYSDADVRGIDENTLKLYRWVMTPPPIGGHWQPVGERQGEGQSLDTANNILTAWLRGLSRFGQMGASSGYNIFLPLVIKSG
jgi:hypothetical protein